MPLARPLHEKFPPLSDAHRRGFGSLVFLLEGKLDDLRALLAPALPASRSDRRTAQEAPVQDGCAGLAAAPAVFPCKGCFTDFNLCTMPSLFAFLRWLLLTWLLLAAPSLVFAWGAWSHQRINRAAVLALPPALRTFFYNHADYITEEAVMPDVRKHAFHDKDEAARHFINLEAYNLPISQLPQTAADARTRFDAATLVQNGTLPWSIQEGLAHLTQAMKSGRKDEILFWAANLGHYFGDAQMPLHTSLNHDGQLTGQAGIHAFFEGQLPERFGSAYDFNVGEAAYLPDPVAETWRLLAASHASADTLLAVERQLQAAVPLADRYEQDARGAVRKNQFGDEFHAPAYAARYHQALGRLVERRLRAAVRSTADFWYTAWVNAGQPDLNRLDSDYTTHSIQRNLKYELGLLKRGRLVDLKTNPEF